jgi:selenocysteine-specific elongation factor
VILGTAGHIDHGKTSLVRVLTGVDTDRLPEEKRRGITIELGFAPLELAGVETLGVVDVPGHEAFVRTMLAGASGIDLALLVVAADEGVMPQTAEHVAILDLLGVRGGVVALTKRDLVDDEWLELVEDDVRRALHGTALEGAPIVATSTTDGRGVDALREALAAAARAVPDRDAADLLRMPVDRAFTVRGTGTVVTGTLWSGRLERDATVRLLPSGRTARVRGLQSHGAEMRTATAGHRTAIALAGVDVGDVGRGTTLVTDPVWAPTRLLRAEVALLPTAPQPVGPRTSVRFHLGTAEVAARLVAPGGSIAPGERRFVRVSLEEPVVARAGDRFVLRGLSDASTIGGGVILDPAPRRHGARREVVERLLALERGEPVSEPIADAKPGPASAPEPEPLDDAALALAALLRADGTTPRADADLAAAAGLDDRSAADRLRRLVQAGQAVRVARNLHFHPDALAEIEARVVALCERDGQATIAGLRDELGSSRKIAQAVLEHMDRAKLTRRDGDAHVLRRR